MSKKKKQAKVSYTFDRLWEQKLSQAFHLLIPADTTSIASEHSIKELIQQDIAYENSGYLHEGVLRPAEGE